MSEHIVETSDATFENDVLKSSSLVLLDFWAPWCGPCRMIAPVLEELAKEYTGRLKVVKMNVDENRATPTKYNVRGIPTLLLVKDGNVVDSTVGAASKSQLVNLIDKHV